MPIRRPLLAIGFALTGATALFAAGCGDRPAEQPRPAAGTSIGTEIDDTVVTAKVKSALLADADIRSFDLKVETRKGVVQLSGFVDNQAQVDRAASTAAGVAGVASIENRIGLKDASATIGSKVDDGVITGKVKSALLADPNIKSLDIAVVTNKGRVQLSGFVDNQGQIDQAVTLAGKVDGVDGIDNELSVKK
jgi:hyperosmotically inducible protein